MQKMLGRLPAKSTRKALNFSDFVKYLRVPKSQTYWRRRKPIPLRSYGNLEIGCCTIAKQAVAATRMELLETGKRITFTDQEVRERYFAMTTELYGGGDTGAYEDDALNRWRNPDLAIRASDGQPRHIAAFLRVNPKDQDEVRMALALSGARGLAICLNLPQAFRFNGPNPPALWNIPAGNSLVGEWTPGSWGGHSLWANGFTPGGIILDHTWECENNVIGWEAVAAYMDEAHVVIDSLNSWKKQQAEAVDAPGKVNLADVRDAVNEVSDIQI